MENKSHQRLSIEAVAEIIEQVKESGLSYPAYARQHKIPYTRLAHYRKRLRESKATSTPGFVRLRKKRHSHSTSKALFIHCGAFKLEITPGIDLKFVSDTLSLVKTHA